MFGFFKSAEKRWMESYNELAEEKITAQDFVDINEGMTLFYTTPVISCKDGSECINALSLSENGTMYMPAFFSAEALVRHYDSHDLVPGVIIKGNLKGMLSALDSVPEIRNWGVMIDPDSETSVGLPPRLRVRPKCLR